MSKPLARLLRREQVAYLCRDHRGWGEHLDRARAFLGEGLQAADPDHPVLILGAGPGLEVPWALAPPNATGWDADPWSRAWTALRHRRWPPWIFGDLTGGLADLEATARRAVAEPWSGRRRDPGAAARRLAGLIPGLKPEPAALRAWIAEHRPGTILSANVMGQFGVVAERLVEAVFSQLPWETDPERPDPLAEALEGWLHRAITAHLTTLADSGADLWLLHDRSVVFDGGTLALGPWTDDWTRQLGGAGAPAAADALAGVAVLSVLTERGGRLARAERWLWPVGPDQRHLVEALALRRSGPDS